jgi:hypothetical protein
MTSFLPHLIIAFFLMSKFCNSFNNGVAFRSSSLPMNHTLENICTAFFSHKMFLKSRTIS